MALNREGHNGGAWGPADGFCAISCSGECGRGWGPLLARLSLPRLRRASAAPPPRLRRATTAPPPRLPQNLLQIDALVDDHDLPREKLDPRVCRVDGVAELSEPPRQLLDAWPEVRAALRASVVHRAAPKTRRPKLAICPLGCGARYAYASGVMKHLAKVHTLHLPVSVQDAMAASLGQTTAKRVRRVAAIRGLLPPLKRKRSRRVA